MNCISLNHAHIKEEMHEKKANIENLNASVTWSFKVDARPVRERLTNIVAKCKRKKKDELDASGVLPEHITWRSVREN